MLCLQTRTFSNIRRRCNVSLLIMMIKTVTLSTHPNSVHKSFEETDTAQSREAAARLRVWGRNGRGDMAAGYRRESTRSDVPGLRGLEGGGRGAF
jgi:hypothetical protein